MAAKDMTIISERLTALETTHIYQSEKIDEIHKILVGNGKPGLIAEWNQWKGAQKTYGKIISYCIAILTVAVSSLAYFR